MDIFLLYLFTRVDVVLFICLIGIFISSTVLLLVSIIYLLERESWSDDSSLLLKWTKRSVVLLAVFATIHLLIPSKKDLAIIVGGHFAVEAAKSDTAKKVRTIIDGLLDEQVEKLKGRAK